MKLRSSAQTIKNMALILGLTVALTANAQLAHYYTYDLDYDFSVDRVGSSNGTVYTDGGSAFLNSNGFWTNGAGGGLSGGVPGTGLLLDSSATAGITGSFAINQWFTGTGNGYQAWLLGFSDGTSQNMLALLEVDNWWPQYPAHAYAGVAGSYTDLWGNAFDNGETIAQDPYYGSWLDDGDTHMVTLTYDTTDLALYIDNNLVSSNALPGFNLSLLTTPVINGGSPWNSGDRSANADTHSFAIFADSLTPAQVSGLYGLGQFASVTAINTVVPEPGTFALLAGILALGLVVYRRRSKL